MQVDKPDEFTEKTHAELMHHMMNHSGSFLDDVDEDVDVDLGPFRRKEEEDDDTFQKMTEMAPSEAHSDLMRKWFSQSFQSMDPMNSVKESMDTKEMEKVEENSKESVSNVPQVPSFETNSDPLDNEDVDDDEDEEFSNEVSNEVSNEGTSIEEKDRLAHSKYQHASSGSSEGIRRHLSRFKTDRQLQVLTPEECKYLKDCLGDHEQNRIIEEWRDHVVHKCVRHLGIVSHHIDSFNWHNAHEYHYHLANNKPYRFFSHGHMILGKTVNSYFNSPTMMINNITQQEAPMTTRDARELLLNYSSQIYEDIILWEMIPPKNYKHPLPENDVPGTKWKNELPIEWVCKIYI